ncbi:MAG TPA: 2-succinyl-5-enolpyruvyl-6-hydroxy-3-cyclohexene-1-carboxylic-acid synthase, partial [Cytophagaceae bacterium]
IEELQPDLLITFGLSVISKNLKLFLRKHRAMQHWHILEAGPAADPFQSLTCIIHSDEESFFEGIFVDACKNSARISYYASWQSADQNARMQLCSFFKNQHPFNEFSALFRTLDKIPDQVILHLANSMTVRYANYLGLEKSNIEVYCNRGTSGIDGIVSTAIGAAMTTDKIVTVISGDMAFFYDRNAFWNNYLPTNLRIVLLNNHSGGIFRIIDGPNKQPELEEYFETYQPLTASSLSKEFDFEYILVNNYKTLDDSLPGFFAASEKIKILEVESNSKTNTEVFHQFKNFIK